MKKSKVVIFILALTVLFVIFGEKLFPGTPIESMELGSGIPLFFCIPFVGMLLSIAVLPMLAANMWEKWRGVISLFWALLFAVPFAIVYGMPTMLEQLSESIIGDYLTFIVLLFGLFCVSGNICLEGDLAGTPRTNVIMLAIGTVLASWIGTTGASMLMIRPLLRVNSWRSRTIQTVVFFIFLVSNIGGALSPIGDPPLLMGFIRGVPFTWELQHMSLITLLNVVLLLGIYYVIDKRAYNKDIAVGLVPASDGTKLRLVGAHNIIFLVMIVGAVILSGVLPSLPLFQNAEGGVLGIHIYGEVELGWPTIIEVALILLAALLSFITTKEKVRRDNNFSWGAIEEVAVLFIGIFITMIPALLFLKAHGAEMGLTEPWQMFWVTGGLSSFLDNTPTYLVFLTTAGALGATAGVQTTVGIIGTKMLMAISCGAVFMGANTYIGNAPNFMVKSIAEESGVRMPSFFHYMLWSLRFLVPIFIIDMLIFFL